MQEKSYTLLEVAENNGKNEKRIWIVIKGVVYDVTDYVEQHPGGAELITEYAGKDATKAFNQAGHSSDASALLKKYRIGVVAEKTSLPVETKQITPPGSYVSQASINSTKSEKRRRIKFLFCV